MRLFHLATLSLAALATLATPAAGQLIPIRTTPIMQADGFQIFPSRQLGMGGVSIALADTLADPWLNPATGARVTGARVFGSPVLYGVSGGASGEPGGGRALPVGGIARSGAWFGAGALALQAVEPGWVPGSGNRLDLNAGPEEAPPARGSAYGFAMAGRSWPERGLSLGGSVLAARRNGADGIGLLFGESERIESSGSLATVRLGLLQEWAGALSLEAVLVHSRTRMTHDVTYADGYWDPEEQRDVWEPREERSADEADVWGLQLVHTRPLSPGWRIGWLVTGNLVRYPSVPRYDVPKDGLMNIRSGRGDAHAYNLGVGASRSDGPMRLGVDLVYEPIWSRIWGRADTAMATASGGAIPAGGTTIENRLRFSNAILRLGAGREWRVEPAGLALDVRLGLATRLIDYRLAQFDYRVNAGRDHHERWIEWTPTWGTSLRLDELEVRYHGSMVHGTERPGASAPRFWPCQGVCLESLSFVGPPPADLSDLGAVRVVTQQISVSVPIGGARRGGGQP